MQLCPDFTNYSLETSPQGHTTKNPGIVWCLLSPNLQLLRCHSHSAVYVCYALGDYNTLKNPCYQNFVLQKQSLASIFYSASLCFFNLRVNMLSGENLLGTTTWRWTMTLQNLFRYSSHCVLRGLCNSRNSALACTKSVLCHFILPRCQSLTITFWGDIWVSLSGTFRLSPALACSKLSNSGEDAKEKGTRKVGGAGKKEKKVSSHFIFVFALSQFSKPDHLGAWNRPLQLSLFVSQLLPTEPWESLLRRQSFYPWAGKLKKQMLCFNWLPKWAR